MARHRDVRNMSYDEYDDEDDDYDQGVGSYGAAHSPGSAAFLYQRPGQQSAAEIAAQHHRDQLAARNSKQQQAELPRATTNSAAFFKTKPAKKPKGGGGGGSTGGGGGASSAWQAGTDRNQLVGAPPPAEELFGGDEFDAETAAAIEASAREAQQREAFLAEAGLKAPVPVRGAAASSSAAAAVSNAAAPAPSPSPRPVRSETDQQATLAALEQLRLEKQRAAAAAAGSASNTPKRGTGEVQRSPSLNSLAGSSVHSSPVAARIDRPNLPLPSRVPSAASIAPAAAASSSTLSVSTLAVPGDSGSQPSTPRSGATSPAPGGSPIGLPSFSRSSSTTSSGSGVGGGGGLFELPDVAPAGPSAKRVREVNAVLTADAERTKESGPAKDRLNLVVIGHVDAGKSTLMGHLLYLQGRVSQKMLHKYEKESRESGKASFHFAWVLDETDEERSRGVTTDVAVQHFDTPSKKITLLDAPGHREFIPNMITGAAQADAGILVVPATKGEFEGGFSEDGQIREHAVLARSLGVAQLILAVNKLDTTGWSQSRYNEIVGLMLPYLKSVGYKEKDIWPVPVSGLTGENILERKEEALKSWYSGPVLLDLIDHFALPPRHADRPLRMCVQDVFKTLSLGQAVAGKVECGTILPRDRLLLLPLGETVTVRALESRGEGVNIARAGDNIELGLRDVSDPAVLQVGQWLCDPLHPIPMVTHFRAQIITMNYRVPLLAGSQLHFFNQACSEPVVLRSLQAIVDKVSGTVTKRNPRVLPRQSTAIVEISARNKICLELFRNYKELGRFTLRRGTETVAVGICIKLYRMQ